MKNIYKTVVRGKKKYCVQLTEENGKRKKKYFDTITEAGIWLKEYKSEKKKDSLDISALTNLQKSDIRTALSLLPANISLTDCVKAYNNKIKNIDLKEAIKEFTSLKKGNITDKYLNDISAKLKKFLENFEKWENIEATKLTLWIKKQSKFSKTQKHYFTIIREFYNYSTTKNYCEDIFKEIHKAEIPKVQRREVKILNINKAGAFFKELEAKEPKLVGLYALVAFGGLRVTEAQRLKEKSFNFEKQEILLPFKDSKTKQTWLQCKMPSNIWKWLEKYPYNKDWQRTNAERTVRKKISIKLERNALRHSFATYHLSLLREAPKTSILMRHTNPSQLWQTYLEGLTSEEEAKKYFAIVPAETTQEDESSLNLPITSEPLA